MTAPDLLSRIDAAIGLRPELADLLGECRAAIVRLSEAAAAPVVDVTAELERRRTLLAGRCDLFDVGLRVAYGEALSLLRPSDGA